MKALLDKILASRDGTRIEPGQPFTRTYRRGQMIHEQAADAFSWVQIEAGSARRSLYYDSGRRQILDFVLSGDVYCPDPESTTEALEDGTVAIWYAHKAVEALAKIDGEVAHGLWRASMRTVRRLEMRTVVLGHPTARKRLAHFLLEIGTRLASTAGEEFRLPMTRTDIGDHLRIAAENVSRELTALRRNGLIELRGSRGVRIVRQDALLAVVME